MITRLTFVKTFGVLQYSNAFVIYTHTNEHELTFNSMHEILYARFAAVLKHSKAHWYKLIIKHFIIRALFEKLLN